MYWEQAGPNNTDATIKLALEKAIDQNINYIIVASSTGTTALKMAGFKQNVICVTYHAGFDGPGMIRMDIDVKKQLEGNNIPVLMTTHLLAGVDRAIRNKFGGVYPAEIMAQTLRMLGQGFKVCVEIAGMALDAGLIPAGEKIISLGGTGKGADTAVIVTPAHSNKFFETKIHEIICKPR